MSKITTALRLLHNNSGEFKASLIRMIAPVLSDKTYLSKMFYYMMGRQINWEKPETYSEKLQWLKLYDRNPEYTKLVDKYEVKSYVTQKVGEQYVAKTLGVYDRPEEIDFAALPQRFVLKTTHGGGNCGVIICKDKSKIDNEKTIATLKSSLKQDLYRDSREWPYKNVKKRVLVEEFLEDKETGELRDYKFFCFDGKVKALFVATERQTREEPYFNFFDKDYKPLDIKQGHPRSDNWPERPEKFSEMVYIAEKLSAGIPHVRVDLYQANGKVYFGEYTFYHFGGIVPFEPESWDKVFGEWLKLPERKTV